MALSQPPEPEVAKTQPTQSDQPTWGKKDEYSVSTRWGAAVKRPTEFNEIGSVSASIVETTASRERKATIATPNRHTYNAEAQLKPRIAGFLGASRERKGDQIIAVATTNISTNTNNSNMTPANTSTTQSKPAITTTTSTTFSTSSNTNTTHGNGSSSPPTDRAKNQQQHLQQGKLGTTTTTTPINTPTFSTSSPPSSSSSSSPTSATTITHPIKVSNLQISQSTTSTSPNSTSPDKLLMARAGLNREDLIGGGSAGGGGNEYTPHNLPIPSYTNVVCMNCQT